MKKAYAHYWVYVRYNIFLGIFLRVSASMDMLAILVQLLVLHAALLTTYTDMFVVAISLHIAGRFQQLATRVESFSRSKVESTIAWMRLREEYDRLSNLCKKLDEALGNLMFLMLCSLSASLLLQLYRSLQYASIL